LAAAAAAEQPAAAERQQQQQSARPQAAAGSNHPAGPGEAPNAARDGHPAGRAHPWVLTGTGMGGLEERSPGD